MSNDNPLKRIEELEVESISDADLEDIAGGVHDESTDACCTCSGRMCSGTSDLLVR
ncbi:MAG: hypothetical protein AAGE94_20125 [Acidobacteriota bacterium]